MLNVTSSRGRFALILVYLKTSTKMLDLECKYDLFGWLYEAVIFRLVDTDDYLNEIYSVQRKHPSNCVTDYGSLVPSLRFSVKRGRIYTRGRARSSPRTKVPRPQSIRVSVFMLSSKQISSPEDFFQLEH